jgi:hypothetical protein
MESLPGLRLLVQRLPRLPTDQTGSVMPQMSADPVDVLLGAVRQLQAMRQKGSRTLTARGQNA